MILKNYKLRMDERWDSIHDHNTRSGDIGVEQQWGSIKQAFQVTAEEVLGRKKGGEKAVWLSSETCHIAEQRRMAKQKRKEGEAAAKHHSYLCRKSAKLEKCKKGQKSIYRNPVRAKIKLPEAKCE